jgi:hypothetical protein
MVQLFPDSDTGEKLLAELPESDRTLLQEAIKCLRSIEWSPICPLCFHSVIDGHRHDCRLAQLFFRTRQPVKFSSTKEEEG